jgi:hypothetical protein
MGGAPVEFTLAGGGGPAQASLIPAAVPGNDVSGLNGVGTVGGGTAIQASQDTVWTITDQDGCASVIVFASGEGQVVVDASLFSASPIGGPEDNCNEGACGSLPIINEHAFEIFYLKFDHLDIENIKQSAYSPAALNTFLQFGSKAPPNYVNPGGSPVPTFNAVQTGGTYSSSKGSWVLNSAFPGCPAGDFCLPNPPGTNPQPAGGYPISLCAIDYVRALVHGYFELPGDPSGRPATNVTINGAPTGAAGSYVLPAGRWVLPEDWPVLATFAGFSSGAPLDATPSSVFAWDLNSGWVFNVGGENPVIGEGVSYNSVLDSNGNNTGILYGPAASVGAPFGQGEGTAGPIGNNDDNGDLNPKNSPNFQVSYGPDYSYDANGQSYSTAGTDANNVCDEGLTLGVGPYDINYQCTDSSAPLIYKPAGSTRLAIAQNGSGPGGVSEFSLTYVSRLSTYLPNGTLNWADAPMPPAQISFAVSGGAGFLNQVNKTGLYNIPTVGGDSVIYPNPFYTEAIPASPLIPPLANNGGYFWDTWGFSFGTTVGYTDEGGFVAGQSTSSGLTEELTDPCPPDFIENTGFISGTVACFVPQHSNANAISNDVREATCLAIGGHWTAVGTHTPPTGSCWINPRNTAVDAGGMNTNNFGPNCPGNLLGESSDTTVDVANGTGFQKGMTVSVYSTVDGHQLASGMLITSIHADDDDGSNSTAITFDVNTVPSTLCVVELGGVFYSEQTGVVVSAADVLSATAFLPGTEIDLVEPFASRSTANASTFIADFGSGSASVVPATAIGGASGDAVIWVEGSDALARELGGCVMSRSSTIGGTFVPGVCEPGTDYLRIDTLVQVGPSQDGVPVGNHTGNEENALGDGQGPYPFWQWVPNAMGASTQNRSATVYSDNHGEAVVSLETGIESQIEVAKGTACPSGYSAGGIDTSTGNQVCTLNLGALGSASTTPGGVPFPAIQALLATFSATNPGCGTYNPATGTFTPIANPVFGPDGSPPAGALCVNHLGGVEFGAGASLGATNIQAIADYPYFRGLHPAISSGTITKLFMSSFAKTVTVTPGAPCNPATATTGCGIPGSAGTTSFTVTITAVDICGQPLSFEPVDVFALGNAGAVVLAPVTSTLNPTSTSTATGTLDANGTGVLTLEVLNTAIGTQGLVIKVVFPREAVERFATVIPGTLPNQTFTALYGAGYNQIGGPPNSNFSSAEAVYLWNPANGGSFSAVTSSDQNLSSAAPACLGYFAYFAAITAVTLPATSHSGDTASCTLPAGWNLVGNPFATPAKLPANVTAYHYDPATGLYSVVGAIPAGGAVWIYNDGTLNTVVLTAT